MSAQPRAPRRRPKPPADWELVLKRNPVERLKREKAPLGIRDELPALIAAGLRERGRGGHRPPAVVGPLPRQAEDRDVHAARQGAGRAAVARPSCARSARSRTSTARATASSRPARTSSSTGSSSRKLPDVFAHLDALGRSRPPAAAATPCATSPAARCRESPPTSSSTRRPIVDRGRRPLLRQPRLGEPAAQAQVLDLGLPRPLQRARDQLHLAGRDDQRRPRGLRACSSAAGSRRCRGSRRRLGVFIPKEEANEILGAITSVWSEDLELPRLAGQGAPQVHGRRHRRRGDARARRGAARPQARGLHAAADRRRALAPPRRARPEAGRALLHRRSRSPRPDLGRPDDRDRRSRRPLRRRHPADAPAELHRHGRPERPDRRGQGRARVDRLPARHQPGARQLDRVHRASRTATSRSPRRRRASAR